MCKTSDDDCFEAELRTLTFGLELAWFKGMCCILVVSDASNVQQVMSQCVMTYE